MILKIQKRKAQPLSKNLDNLVSQFLKVSKQRDDLLKTCWTILWNMCGTDKNKQSVQEYSIEKSLVHTIKENSGWDRQEFETYQSDYEESRNNVL